MTGGVTKIQVNCIMEKVYNSPVKQTVVILRFYCTLRLATYIITSDYIAPSTKPQRHLLASFSGCTTSFSCVFSFRGLLLRMTLTVHSEPACFPVVMTSIQNIS